MEFGLVTVARAAQIPAARATIDSARQSGFTSAVHAVALGIDVDSATIDDEWISFLSVMPEAAAARRLAPFGFDALSSTVIASAILHALRTETAVVYLAPTIHVVAPLDEIAALADHRLALVDRPRAGAPDDAKHPTEADLVGGHRYSTSIIAATRESWAPLEWWRDVAWTALRDGEAPDLARLLDRLAHRFGVATPPQPSRFADWYSLGVDRPRDDGLTVTVGEHALVSVDVDGRDARHPHRLDAGQPLPHRVTLSELPTLAAVLESRPTVSAHNDQPVLPTGLRFDHIMRDTYRGHLRDALEHAAEAPPNPFD